MCTDIMEIKSTYENILKSFISNKKILLIQPGNNIEGFNFSGLNFQTKYDIVNNLDEIKKYKNEHFDYIIIHGFLLRDFERKYKIEKIEKLISCDNFVIDMMGEGDGLIWLIPYFDNIINFYFNFNKVKYVGVLPHYHGYETKFKNWDFFSYEFGGPRIFCSPTNSMIHPRDLDGNITTLLGLKYSDKPKTKLYSCLNNQNRIHRNWVIDSIINKNILNQGYVSNLNGGDFPSYSYKNGDEIVHYTLYNPILKIDTPTNFFGIHSNIDSDCYINLVNETSPREFPFMTEKSVKPFYTLQFPIIFGYSGIVDELRSYGFDMFDDFINHEYDNIKLKLGDSNNPLIFHTYLKHKSDMITDEIKRLSELDIHDFYIQSKDRLIYNQNLLYQMTVENNSILKDIGYWLFADSISFTENRNFKTEYISET